MRSSFTVLAVLVAAVAAQAEVVVHQDAHDTGTPFVFVGSSVDGGGALVAEHDFTAPIVVTETTTASGFVLYTSAEPSFEPLEADDPEESLFQLDDGTIPVIEIVAIDPRVGIKVKGTSLVDVGDRGVFGPAPDLHFHPEWQLTLPEGEVACAEVTFRVVADAGPYAASEEYTAILTNDEHAHCPKDAHCGDPDGSGTVTVTDGVNVLRGAANLDSSCDVVAACDVDGNGAMTVTDGVNVLRAAASLPAEMTCPNL